MTSLCHIQEKDLKNLKIDRLVAILLLLLDSDRVSASSLASRFGVSVRTILRDMESLDLAGIPIVSFPGAGGGFSVLEGFKIDRRLFSAADFAAILSGLRGLDSALPTEEGRLALEKMRSLVPRASRSSVDSLSRRIHVDLASWTGDRLVKPYLDLAGRALRENRLLSFGYRDREGKSSARRAEPYQLVLKENDWYLQAYCLDRNAFRIFKLSRMSALALCPETFTPRAFEPKPMDGSGWMEGKLITAELLADASLRETLADRCGADALTVLEDGRILVELPFAEDDYGYRFLLGLGEACECLGPPRVREELRRRLEVLLARYADAPSPLVYT